MAMSVSRMTEPLRFDVGIGRAGYADILESPAAEGPAKTLLPGTTTVTQAVDGLFPSGQDVGGEIMQALVAANPALFRTSGGFSDAARRAVVSLREKGSDASSAAARELDALLADTDLFERYRLSLLET